MDKYDAVDNMEFELAMHMYNIYLLFQILTTLYYFMAKSGIWTYIALVGSEFSRAINNVFIMIICLIFHININYRNNSV